MRKLAGIGLLALLAGLVAAACGGTETIEVVKEVEVIKEVEVEKVVEVEKIVTETVEVEKIVVQAPTATPVPPTPTPRAAGDIEYEWLFKDSLGFYGFGIEAVREMIDRAYGGKIIITPSDGSRLGSIQFQNANPELAGRLIQTQSELDILLWREGGIAVTGAPAANTRPHGLWSHYPRACVMFFSRDPEIQSIADMDGKTVYVGTQGHVSLIESNILFTQAGVKPNVVVGGRSGRDRLADGEIDATLYWTLFADSMSASEDPKTHTAMQLNGDWHFVDTPLALIEKARAANPEWVNAGALAPVKVFKGGLRTAARTDYDIIQKEGLHCMASGSPTFHTAPSAPEDVVYATMKGILDNREASDDYFSFYSKLWQDRLGHYGVPQANFHPGAARAYDEAGVTFGMEGIEEWAAANPNG